MTTVQQYCLRWVQWQNFLVKNEFNSVFLVVFRWNNHQPNFISVFSSLLMNETLVDVTLAAEGRQLQAHKVVLSACSSYFQVRFH